MGKAPYRVRIDDAHVAGAVYAPIDEILTSGGDTRLHLDPDTLLNAYGCRPFPRPEAYTFASATATSISERAYRAAGAMHQALTDAAGRKLLHPFFDDQVEHLREHLIHVLGLEGTGHALVFSPSGTDSELHAVFVALATLGGPLVSVIAACDETGSGTSLAAAARHFSSLTSRGKPVTKGDAIAGMAEHAESVGVPLRGEDGTLRAMEAIDRDVVKAVETAVRSGRRVLLHAMDHSKLGWHSPTVDCVHTLAARFPDRVQVVIDACQMRISRNRLKRYLDDGFVVQVTGSKFFTGPPFSGALFVPSTLAARVAEVTDVPPGLRDYTSRHDWPAAWTGVRKNLGDSPNIGQFLRWVAATEEMDFYFAVPDGYRRLALARFTSTVPTLIASHPNFELLPDCPCETWDENGNDELAVRTIFPFLMRRDGDVLSVDDARIVYRALNRNIGPLLAPVAGALDGALGGQLCHIGQPVAVRDGSGVLAGAIRINAGARIVSETWSNAGENIAHERLAHEVAQVRTVLDKIQLILRHFDRLRAAFCD